MFRSRSRHPELSICPSDDPYTTALPTVTLLSPDSGTTAGGTEVTIVGTDLTGATAVTFGEASATSFHVWDPTHISAVTPARAASAVEVRVTTSNGTSVKTATYTYTGAS